MTHVYLFQEEGEYYNVPVTGEGEDISANLKKMRVIILFYAFDMIFKLLFSWKRVFFFVFLRSGDP